ncbi:ubiquitin carboxyl-terminal hydrolase MINDY-2-like [Polyodon spathula]|uniref:ubiquitin carboxyl-terminal hydrolase MINDY-2-like n=1 Tax=Polyodon spathula TaxID=7913 RepID=UPI001B7E7FEF|nr:ubiquitin carboxyl-terminal hydrolase MINDY-2-like [Polyodon spathula]
MENNAEPQQDLAGGTACSSTPVGLSEKKAISGLKNTSESCKNSEATTAVAVDCSAVACVDNQKSNNNSVNCSSLPVKGTVCPSGSVKSGLVEQTNNSNGMGQTQPGGGDVGDTTKVVNKTIETPAKTAAGIIDVMKGVNNEDSAGQQKISQGTGTCQDEKTPPSSTRSLSKAAVSSDSVAEELSGSDRSAQGESLSITSLESFSNLNQSDNSEGADDGVLALALQTDEYDSAGGDAKLAALIKGQSVYHIKWIQWKEENTPIITQNENGPCPLLAIMNVLLLAWKVKMPPMMEVITAEQLMEYLGDYILDAKPKEISEIQRLNYEQNMSDAMAVLHKLQTGLDVNVKFTGVRVFEYTPECIVFDLLDIPLYHGWLVDPQIDDIVKAVGNCSYNQLVEKIIISKQSNRSELVGEGYVAEQFLNSTATQLTYHGLCELTSAVQEGELCVFFRNNHFSTMTKYKGQLYLLVTDQGFLTEERVVWESLHNVDGDGNFCDSEFHLRPPSGPETVYRGQQDQIDQDYMMALSLQQEQQSQDLNWEQLPEGVSDLELAKKLQEEEDRRASQFYQEQEQAAAAQAQAQGEEQAQGGEAAAAAATATSPGKQLGNSERKHKKEAKDKDKDREKDRCVLL